MSTINVLTDGGIQLLHSFPSDSDHIPLKLQVLEVKNMSINPVRIDIVVAQFSVVQRVTTGLFSCAGELHYVTHNPK
jgi:hypothetical protein